MIIDKVANKVTKQVLDAKRKERNNMKLTSAEISQLEALTDFIQDSIESVVTTKTVKRKRRNEDKSVVVDEAGNEVWEDHTIEKLSFKKDIEDYNIFRRRKKEYVKGLTSK